MRKNERITEGFLWSRWVSSWNKGVALIELLVDILGKEAKRERAAGPKKVLQ